MLLIVNELTTFCSLIGIANLLKIAFSRFYLLAVMGTHSFIRYFVTVTVTSLVAAVTNEFLFSSACNEVTEAIGDFKND
jgi:hypothetical protein